MPNRLPGDDTTNQEKASETMSNYETWQRNFSRLVAQLGTQERVAEGLYLWAIGMSPGEAALAARGPTQ